jgi:hypothetical protein
MIVSVSGPPAFQLSWGPSCDRGARIDVKSQTGRAGGCRQQAPQLPVVLSSQPVWVPPAPAMLRCGRPLPSQHQNRYVSGRAVRGADEPAAPPACVCLFPHALFVLVTATQPGLNTHTSWRAWPPTHAPLLLLALEPTPLAPLEPFSQRHHALLAYDD